MDTCQIDWCTTNAMPTIDTAPAALKINTSLPDDYFDGVFMYLNSMLMEEDLEQKAYTYQISANALDAAEKSFYDALKGKDSLISPVLISAQVSHQEIISTDLSTSNLDRVKFQPFRLQSSLEEPNEIGYVPNVVGRKETRSRVDDDDDDDDDDERGAKQIASFVDEDINDLEAKYDDLLLCPARNPGFYVETLSCDIDQTEGRYSPPIMLPNQPKRGRPRASEKNVNKKQVVDLNSLLSQCADSVVSCDYRIANRLLNQIRQHSSPYGSGTERLAYWFANALEARMSGSGTAGYSAFSSKETISC